jgi:hypothetical protein
MRDLPDPDLTLRDATDFVFDSALCRRALTDPEPRNLAIFLRELILVIYRLAASCHLPEFTDHGLGHLCSVVDRLSRWTVVDAEDQSVLVVAQQMFQPVHASELLMATLMHDMGMLSQRPEDLPLSADPFRDRLGRDLPGWVRATHVSRLPRLVDRLFQGTAFAGIVGHEPVKSALSIACAHSRWPWQWNDLSLTPVTAGLAAMLAVADLLDEDSLRCDTATLLNHRHGSPLNCAHWIRHRLTVGRILVHSGRVRVGFARPPATGSAMESVFQALRNHYQLARLYDDQLRGVNAGPISFEFDPSAGLPNDIAAELGMVWELPAFASESALVYHLLDSFMPEALLDARRLADRDRVRLAEVGLVEVGLEEFYAVRGTRVPRTSVEQQFRALLPNA